MLSFKQQYLHSAFRDFFNLRKLCVEPGLRLTVLGSDYETLIYY